MVFPIPEIYLTEAEMEESIAAVVKEFGRDSVTKALAAFEEEEEAATTNDEEEEEEDDEEEEEENETEMEDDGTEKRDATENAPADEDVNAAENKEGNWENEENFYESDTPPMNSELCEVSLEELTDAVITLRGLVGFLTSDDMFGITTVLDAISERETQPCFLILRFINQRAIRTDTASLEENGFWIVDGLNSIAKIMSAEIHHPFIHKITEEVMGFLSTSQEDLHLCGDDIIDFMGRVLNALAAHFHTGKSLMAKLIGDLWVVSNRFREGYEDHETDLLFHLVAGLILTIWDNFCSSFLNTETEKKRNRKGKVTAVRAKLSLTDHMAFREELERWQEVLTACLEGLPITHPGFCSVILHLDENVELVAVKLKKGQM